MSSPTCRIEDFLTRFQSHYEAIAKPFKWNFTKEDLHRLLAKVSAQHLERKPAAA